MSINEVVTAYVAAKEQEKIIAEQVKTLAEQIKSYAGKTDCFETDDYSVLIKTTESIRLDTKALYHDFPDIKNTYGKITTSKSILPVAKVATKSA